MCGFGQDSTFQLFKFVKMIKCFLHILRIIIKDTNENRKLKVVSFSFLF